MKTNLNRVIMLSCFVFLLFINSVAAQTPAATPPQVNNEPNDHAAPAMGDDDHLPFMHDERGGAAGSAAESNTGGLLVRTVGAMLLIVGLIFFGAWGVKKFGANFGLFQSNAQAKPDAPDLTVLNSVNLAAGRTLYVIRFGERNLLLGSTTQSFTLLADEETNVEQTALPGRPSRSVADLLAEENNSFARELDSADERFNLFGNKLI